MVINKQIINTNLYRIGFICLCVFIFLQTTTYAQQVNEGDEIKATIEVLKDELAKSGADIASVKFTTTESNNGFVLNKLTPSVLEAYKLNEAPLGSFYIKATDKSVHIVSGSSEGLRNGVYWYLQHLGYRYYFPNAIWNYQPSLKTVFKPVEKTVKPSFFHRRIWYAYGTGSKQANKDYKQWAEANLLGGEEVNAGHSYEGIVNRNKDVFLQHPEYFAQTVEKGEIPGNPKFEVSNENLVQVVIKDAFAQIETRLNKTGQLPEMISMDPSDGGGFSTRPASLKIGGPSEQTFYLANRVAKAVRSKYPAIKIGLYAYNLHAVPPMFELEPNIVVLVATALNRSAYRTDELIGAWKKKGIEVGIRDYFGVMAWDWDMPGRVRGGKLKYVKQLKDYYKAGIRYFSAETNIGWISRGLGHYVGAQLLWDINADAEKISNEFYSTMFGRAGDDIEKLFSSWQSYVQELPLDGDLHQWSKWIEDAAKAESDEKIQQRIDCIKQYLHYVVLFKKWRENNSDSNLVQLLSYAYRIQDDGIAASYPLFRRLANSAVDGKQNMRFDDPKAVWKKKSGPVSRDEIEHDFISDLRAFNVSQKTVKVKLPNQFKERAVAAGRGTASGPSSQTSLPIRLRGRHKIVFQVQDNASINLSAGLIKTKNFKTLRLSIYAYNTELNTDGEVLMNESVAPKQPLKAISLSSLKPGIYIALIDDARQGFTLSFSGMVSYAVVAENYSRIWTFGRNNLVLEVGQVKEFQLKNEGYLTLVSPRGRVIDMQKQKGNFTIKVEKGEAGVWKIQKQSGVFYLSGLLPFVNPDQSFLLRAD